MAVVNKLASSVPVLSPFQEKHVGTTVTGLSGILPYQHNRPAAILAPNGLSGAISLPQNTHFGAFAVPPTIIF